MRTRKMLAVFLFSATALAQEKGDLTQLSLEQLMQVQVVYAASKQDQNPRYAPSSITIVSAAQIDQFGYRNLADILRSVRGFYVTNDRNYSYVGVRGFGRPGDYNTRILLMIDGHRLNDDIYDSALIGNEFPLDAALIERVEIVRGPSSSIYGTNAFFAVVNVITRRPASSEVSADAASYGTYHERTTLSEGNAIASMSALDSRGQTLAFPGLGVTSGTDFERSRNAFAAYRRGGFSVEGLYSSREKGIPTGSFGTIFDDRGNKTTDGSGWVDLSYERALRPDLKIEARAHADSYWYDGSYVFDYPPVTVNQDRTRGQWWGTELIVRSTRFARQSLLAGGEFQDNVRQEQLNYDRDPYFSYLDERHRSQRWAVYGQDEIRISSRALLNAGVREDWYGNTAHFSPRAALILSPKANTTFKALYGEAFRAPNQYEQYYATQTPLQLSNNDLNPETIRTFELVAEHFINENFELQASAFVYRMNGLISLVTTPEGALQFQNADRIAAHGIESEVAWQSDNKFSANLSYAWQRSRIDAASRLTNSPSSMAKLRIAMPALHGISGGIETQYLSRRLTLAGDEAPSALVTNVTLLAQHISRHLDASASVYNVFNAHYADPGSEEHTEDVIPQDGRSFRLKLTWRF